MRVSTRLLLIIAACLVPAIGLYAMIGWTLWADRKAQLGELALQQAELLAGDVSSIAEGARILLAGAAEFHQVRALGSECSSRLTSLQRNTPSFAFLAYVDAAGQIRCASDPAVIGQQSDLIGLRDIPASIPSPAGPVEATPFTAGGFTRSGRYPGGFVPFYLPIQATEPPVGGTLVGALDLNWLEQHLHQLKRAGSPFLTSGVLTVADANGTVLARDVRHAEFVGQQFPPAAMPIVHAVKPGILRMKSLDGTFRLVGFTPPTPENHSLAVAVGFYEPDLMGDVQRALLHWALLLAGVMGTVFGLATFIARRGIAQPTQVLLAMAKRWREGDLTARAPTGQGQSQFDQITAAYNEMAAALQQREEKLRAYACSQEEQVAQRTGELLLANDRLRREIMERQNTEAALLQAQKMQAVGQLAGGIAHDFNNILQMVLGSAGLVQRRANDPDSVQRLGRMIEDAARRGTSITRRLLAFSRREELQAEVLDVSELVNGLHEVLATTLGVGVAIQIDAQAGLPSIRADRGQFETVLVNLATNARDAMPDGGTLRISAGTREVLKAEDPQEMPEGSYVCITVSDTGEGMDEETLARASEPFFTTKPLGQGTGLGLAMARSFVEGSGGRLIISSSVGEGTQIALWLPAFHQEAGANTAPGEAVRRSPCDHRALRILLVDDEPAVREILAIQLADAGHEVAQAEDGQAALAFMELGQPVDLLVSDLAMPGLDGVALIRAARRRHPALPAILITGYAGEAAEVAIGRAIGGRFTLLRKPLTGIQLVDHVAALTAVTPDGPADLARMARA